MSALKVRSRDFGIDGVSLTITTGVNNGEGSPVVFGESKDQPAHPSGRSTLTDGDDGCIPRGYALLRAHRSNTKLPDSTTRT